MRVLLSTTAGTGHFGPLIPLANACAAAGETVAVAAPSSFAESVTGAGFAHLPFGAPPPELIGEVFGRIEKLPFEEANRVVLAEVFGRLDAQAALPALSRIITDWRPDVIVREACEFGSWVAADDSPATRQRAFGQPVLITTSLACEPNATRSRKWPA
jgi:UDP:flavonoid glycosyltransferase YjiC (YdhE family)